jgi:tryptophan synthase alpha subunit
VKTREQIEELGKVGADAAIVGSNCVARVTAARDAGRDVVEDFQGLLVELGAASQSIETPR